MNMVSNGHRNNNKLKLQYPTFNFIESDHISKSFVIFTALHIFIDYVIHLRIIYIVL